jgi:hypothetical protein
MSLCDPNQIACLRSRLAAWRHQRTFAGIESDPQQRSTKDMDPIVELQKSPGYARGP